MLNERQLNCVGTVMQLETKESSTLIEMDEAKYSAEEKDVPVVIQTDVLGVVEHEELVEDEDLKDDIPEVEAMRDRQSSANSSSSYDKEKPKSPEATEHEDLDDIPSEIPRERKSSSSSSSSADSSDGRGSEKVREVEKTMSEASAPLIEVTQSESFEETQESKPLISEHDSSEEPSVQTKDDDVTESGVESKSEEYSHELPKVQTESKDQLSSSTNAFEVSEESVSSMVEKVEEIDSVSPTVEKEEEIENQKEKESSEEKADVPVDDVPEMDELKESTNPVLTLSEPVDSNGSEHHLELMKESPSLEPEIDTFDEEESESPMVFDKNESITQSSDLDKMSITEERKSPEASQEMETIETSELSSKQRSRSSSSSEEAIDVKAPSVSAEPKARSRSSSSSSEEMGEDAKQQTISSSEVEETTDLTSNKMKQESSDTDSFQKSKELRQDTLDEIDEESISKEQPAFQIQHAAELEVEPDDFYQIHQEEEKETTEHAESKTPPPSPVVKETNDGLEGWLIKIKIEL